MKSRSSYASVPSLLLSSLVAAVALSAATAIAIPVSGDLSITVTNQPASNQFCVGDSVAFNLDLSRIPTTNPQNASDPTYFYILFMGPPQDPSVDPTGISKTPRGLVLGAVPPTPISAPKTSSSVVVPDKVKGFTGLTLRAVVSYASQLGNPEALQNAANSSPAFSISASSSSCSNGGGGGGGNVPSSACTLKDTQAPYAIPTDGAGNPLILTFTDAQTYCSTMKGYYKLAPKNDANKDVISRLVSTCAPKQGQAWISSWNTDTYSGYPLFTMGYGVYVDVTWTDKMPLICATSSA
ncbi:hypothetical protein DFJ73DRAFT_828140 [Zopfochytrium polystomum]|nr:hypothetical protein DFJ73DRAFT_828140 [Zopfochytrium polystomum]